MNDFDVRAEILATISKTDDPVQRSFLLLMLGVLERVDKLLSDEEALQAKVLNGLTFRHKADHEWLAGLREMDLKTTYAWTVAKMNDERETQAQKKTFWSTAFSALVVKVVELSITTAIAIIAALWVMK